MVTNTEANGIVSSIEWAEEGYQLKEFAKKFDLPQVGRIIKGQYEGIGVPSLSCPSSKSIALWFNGGKVLKIAAQCVKFKEYRNHHKHHHNHNHHNSSSSSSACRPVPFGPKLAIPDNYDGYFEILSEEGRSVRCIESVAELAKRFPESCILREAIKVNLAKSDDVNIVADKQRTLPAGETLNLITCESTLPPTSSSHNNGNNGHHQQVSSTPTNTTTSSSSGSASSSNGTPSPLSTCSSSNGHHPANRSSPSYKTSSSIDSHNHRQSSTQPQPPPTTSQSSSTAARYLKCQTNKGETVYLCLESKGKFSPLAKEESISGVHRISSLLMKRLPLMVRLVSGKHPTGFKSFVPEMRLFNVFEEDYLLAMPIHKECNNYVTVPLSIPLKVIGAKNGEALQSCRQYLSLTQRFNETKHEPPSKIQVFESSSLCKDMKNNWKEVNGLLVGVTGNPVDNSCNTTAGVDVGQVSAKYDHKRRLFQSNSCDLVKKSVLDCSSLPEMDNESCYDEIDQIYDYVRGFAPLPEKIRNSFTKCDSNKPEPPPIETIPTNHVLGGGHRRLSYPTFVHEIMPKASLFEKKVSSPEHIYEKVPFSRPEKRYHAGPGQQSTNQPRIPMRSNSTGKMYLPIVGGQSHLLINPLAKPKLFIKSNQPFANGFVCNAGVGHGFPGSRGQTKTSKLMKYAKGLAGVGGCENMPSKDFGYHYINNNNNNNINDSNNKWTCRSSRSLTTSPLFNIRYKSLTNLHFINPLAPSKGLDHSNNTLDSSNSGGQISSGSGGSGESPSDSKAKARKLSRPLSFSNLFWDLKNDFNMAKCEIDPRISSIPSGEYIGPIHPISNHRRVGTLYL